MPEILQPYHIYWQWPFEVEASIHLDRRVNSPIFTSLQRWRPVETVAWPGLPRWKLWSLPLAPIIKNPLSHIGPMVGDAHPIFEDLCPMEQLLGPWNPKEKWIYAAWLFFTEMCIVTTNTLLWLPSSCHRTSHHWIRRTRQDLEFLCWELWLITKPNNVLVSAYPLQLLKLGKTSVLKENIPCNKSIAKGLRTKLWPNPAKWRSTDAGKGGELKVLDGSEWLEWNSIVMKKMNFHSIEAMKSSTEKKPSSYAQKPLTLFCWFV